MWGLDLVIAVLFLALVSIASASQHAEPMETISIAAGESMVIPPSSHGPVWQYSIRNEHGHPLLVHLGDTQMQSTKDIIVTKSVDCRQWDHASLSIVCQEPSGTACLLHVQVYHNGVALTTVSDALTLATPCLVRPTLPQYKRIVQDVYTVLRKEERLPLTLLAALVAFLPLLWFLLRSKQVSHPSLTVKSTSPTSEKHRHKKGPSTGDEEEFRDLHIPKKEVKQLLKESTGHTSPSKRYAHPVMSPQ